MNGTGRDQKLVSDRRVTDLPCDLELHLAFQDDDQFVGRMREILPSPPWRVDPEVATEPPLRPIGCNLFPVDARHRQMCLQEFEQSGSVAGSQHEFICRDLHFEKYALTRSSNCSPLILAPQVLGILTTLFTLS